MRRRIAPPGALAGVAGALLIALGTALLRDLPSTGASDLDVYSYFLDERDTVRVGAVCLLLGALLLVPFLASLRIGEAIGPRRPAAAATLMCGAIGAAAIAFAAAVIGGLAVGAENADPGTSRTLLDLAGAVMGGAGAALTVAALCASADAHGQGAPSWVPALWTLCGLSLLLWLGPLLSDAAALRAGSIAGTFAGVAGLLVWTGSAALLARRRDPRIVAAERAEAEAAQLAGSQ
ncbi:MAG: hypothetical protein U0R24_07970 [Solirubrobacterales bacterium]